MLSNILKLGGISILEIWGDYSKLAKFFQESQYEVALRSLGDVTLSAGIKSLGRAETSMESRKENALIGIAQLQIAHEAYLQKGRKKSLAAEIPFAGAIVELRKASNYEKASKVAQIIALAYEYIGDTKHAKEFLNQAIDDYDQSHRRRQIANTHSFSPPTFNTQEELEYQETILVLKALIQ